MRVVARIAALASLVLLGACDPVNTDANKDKAVVADFATSEAAAAFAATGSPFDFRYAYRLPGDRVKPVLESNADACDRLGPKRCRILAMRYRVQETNRITAVLTVKIDAATARAFGDAVTRVVSGADGVLVDTEVSSGESAASRSDVLVDRIRREFDRARSDPAAAERAARLRDTLRTIAEVQGADGDTMATTPVLITYESNSSLSPLGTTPEASLRNAGKTLETSVAGMVNLLAGIGPWLILMVLVVAALRWAIHGRGDAVPAESVPVSNAVPVPPEEPRDRNLIQRWFGSGDEDDRR